MTRPNLSPFPLSSNGFGHSPPPVDDPAAAAPLIREWHTMSAVEQAAEWAELVAWVVWIHDLYELAKEERLPLCWPRHPGLVEELRSLKVWRTAIYDSPEAMSAPHTARSWHGELRQTIAAAMSFWAPGCRTGHTDAPLLDAVDSTLAMTWQTAGPPVMASAPVPPDRTTLSHEEMLAELGSGAARTHSRGTPHFAKLDGSWWTRAPNGGTWERCRDDDQHALLDATSERLRAADTSLDNLNRR